MPSPTASVRGKEDGMTGQKKPIRNFEDFQRAMQAMYHEHGISEDPEVRRSAMGNTAAFTPLKLGGPRQKLNSTNVTPHVEASDSNDKNPGKGGE